MSKKTDNDNSKTTKSSSGLGLSRISFYLTVAIAILHLVAIILSNINTELARPANILQGVANALMICIVAILGFKYARHKSAVCVVLYIIVLLIVIAGIVLPIVLL